MSTNSNTPNNSEEVDLGQLFKLIGNAFDRFFNFIRSIFTHLFLAFVWFVLFLKKRIIILALAGISGLIIGSLSSKTAPPKYKSSVTVVQNYPTGENLYNSVGYYNDLLKQRDYETLGSVLNLDLEKTKSILIFDVQPVVSSNNKLLAFNKYMKQLDSLAATKIDYEDFLVKNWSSTSLGKKYDIYEVEGEMVGQQYPSDTGPIDILAISKDKKTLLVVELKKGRVSDSVVGQIQRYMGFVKSDLAEENQKVKGVIIGLEDDLRLIRALSVTSNIDFYKYKVNFKLYK